MSFVMSRMVAKGAYASFDPHKTMSERFSVFVVQCRCCGYEPEDAVRPPRTCPKCHSQSWERFARPGSILANAERYPE